MPPPMNCLRPYVSQTVSDLQRIARMWMWGFQAGPKKSSKTHSPLSPRHVPTCEETVQLRDPGWGQLQTLRPPDRPDHQVGPVKTDGRAFPSWHTHAEADVTQATGEDEWSVQLVSNIVFLFDLWRCISLFVTCCQCLTKVCTVTSNMCKSWIEQIWVKKHCDAHETPPKSQRL